MGDKDIQLPGSTPIAAVDALKKTGYNVLVNKDISETSDANQTMLDVFPELFEDVPEEGGKVEDINPDKPKKEKITMSKEVLPKGKQKETHESTAAAGGASTGAFSGPFITKSKETNEKKEEIIRRPIGRVMSMNVNEEFLSTDEIKEIISGQPGTKESPSTTPAPVITPTKTPEKRPERKNPFKPQHNPKPKARGILPSFLNSDNLGIGNLNESKKIKEDINNEEGFNPTQDLMTDIKRLRLQVIRLLHVKDMFEKSYDPQDEIKNITKIIQYCKNRI
jgi:hypothetical protein